MPSHSIAVERESGDRQRLALGTGCLDPIVSAAGVIAAVPDLGDDAFEPDLAGMLEHLAAVDLKTFAELDRGLGDQPFQMCFALDQWQLSQIVYVEIEQIESDHCDLGRFPLEFVLQHTEISVLPLAAGTTTSPSIIADPALIR
jgi:hypothetical protein